MYGGNAKMPFSEQEAVDHPVSLYAGTKKANELMAHTYSHLYGLPTTGLRFFTVYGPWGRPGHGALPVYQRHPRGEPIKVFNHGQMQRDFTYIDDIVEEAWSARWTAGRPTPATTAIARSGRHHRAPTVSSTSAMRTRCG